MIMNFIIKEESRKLIHILLTHIKSCRSDKEVKNNKETSSFIKNNLNIDLIGDIDFEIILSGNLSKFNGNP